MYWEKLRIRDSHFHCSPHASQSGSSDHGTCNSFVFESFRIERECQSIELFLLGLRIGDSEVRGGSDGHRLTHREGLYAARLSDAIAEQSRQVYGSGANMAGCGTGSVDAAICVDRGRYESSTMSRCRIFAMVWNGDADSNPKLSRDVRAESASCGCAGN
jgi:hypothetical protein